MRVPIYFTLLLILSLALLAHRNQSRLGELRSQQEQLSHRARAEGWVPDPRAPDGLANTARATRPDQEKLAREVAAALVSYARELPFPDDLSPAEKSRREALESSRLEGLEGNQLLVVIDELRAATDAPPLTISNFVKCALHRLARSHPRDAFLISMELILPEAFRLEFEAELLRAWAADEPHAVDKWLGENADKFQEPIRRSLREGLIRGALASDPLLALERHRTSDSIPTIHRIIEELELTTTQRLALLQAWRSCNETKDQDAITLGDQVAFFQSLLLGSKQAFPPTLAEASEFWKEAKLSPDEIHQVSLGDLSTRIDPEESLEWYHWIAENFSAADATRIQTTLLRRPAASKRIREWLETQPGTREEAPDHLDEPGARLPAGTRDYPVAAPVPDQSGHAFSPYTGRIIDLRGIPSGALVKDPENGGFFRVP